ncbi:hypothetical protein [Streptomyces sp. NPDC020996]|uniref:hypothetical protein n=1 Tax=Streptomyces sp. NPDC020996 TaxID=3154791 RepID=UPI0033CF3466
MIFVAVLLLPSLCGMLVLMDRLEDRLLDPAPARRRHAGRRRHLRLVSSRDAAHAGADVAPFVGESATTDRRAA